MSGDGAAVGHGWAPDAPGRRSRPRRGRLADAGVTTFEVTAIERDGLLIGPDWPSTDGWSRSVAAEVIASAGIATVADLRAVRAIGCSGAIVGRALYEGRLDLADAIAAVRDLS